MAGPDVGVRVGVPVGTRVRVGVAVGHLPRGQGVGLGVGVRVAVGGGATRVPLPEIVQLPGSVDVLAKVSVTLKIPSRLGRLSGTSRNWASQSPLAPAASPIGELGLLVLGGVKSLPP